MARRKNNNDWFKLLCELFTSYSAWLCIPIALFAFKLINGFLNWVAESAPAFAGVSALTPIFGGSIAFVILAAGLKAGLEKMKRTSPFKRTANNEILQKLTRLEFRLLVTDFYSRMGFEVVPFDSDVTDETIDLKLRDDGEITLVKCHNGNDRKIGAKPIRELYAVQKVEGADRSIFVTSGTYTRQARSFVIGKQIELIDGEQLLDWVHPTGEELIQVHSGGPLPKNEESPSCPSCQKSMLLQTVKRGPNHGSQFWSCREFPRCQGMRQLSEPSA